MCKNMVVSEVCAVSKVLSLVSNGHYTKSDNCSVAEICHVRGITENSLSATRKG
jgi:hypothetical protein